MLSLHEKTKLIRSTKIWTKDFYFSSEAHENFFYSMRELSEAFQLSAEQRQKEL